MKFIAAHGSGGVPDIESWTYRLLPRCAERVSTRTIVKWSGTTSHGRRRYEIPARGAHDIAELNQETARSTQVGKPFI
jgi:hypothetical protein